MAERKAFAARTLKRQRNPTKPLQMLGFVNSTQPTKRTFVSQSGSLYRIFTKAKKVSRLL